MGNAGGQQQQTRQHQQHQHQQGMGHGGYHGQPEPQQPVPGSPQQQLAAGAGVQQGVPATPPSTSKRKRRLMKFTDDGEPVLDM
jgi:hypothetical protein